MVTLVTTGTIQVSTMDKEGTTRRDPSFLRAERRRKSRAAKGTLETSAREKTRCSDTVRYSRDRVEGPVEETSKMATKRAGRRGRHRDVVRRREVETGLLTLVSHHGGTEQDPKEQRVRVHSLLDTATMYGTHTPLTRVAAKVACGGSNASEHKAHGADPAHSWVAVNPQDSPRNPSTERSQDDGILLIVPARLYGHKVQCLVDSGATRCYMSPDIQLAAGLNCTASETFLELADGTRVISAGRAPAVLFSIGGNSFRMDFTVTKLLHGVDLVLGMTWLQRVNPLIDWTVPRLLLESEHQLSAVRGQWIASTEAPGTVKVIDDAKWASMRGSDRDLTTNLEILQTPTFWRYAQSSMPWRAKDAGGGGKHGDPHKSPVDRKSTRLNSSH